MTITSDQDGNSRVTTPIALGVLGFASLCVCTVAALVWRGIPIDQFVQFLSPFVSIIVTAVVITKRQEKMQTSVDQIGTKADVNHGKLENIQHQVNGKLDLKFNDLAAEVQDLRRDTTAGFVAIQNQLNAQDEVVNILAQQVPMMARQLKEKANDIHP